MSSASVFVQPIHPGLIAVVAAVMAACTASGGSDATSADAESTGGATTDAVTTGEESTAAPPTTSVASTDTGATTGEDSETGEGPAKNALWIPPTLSGTTFDLTLDKASKQLLDGSATATYGYNGLDFWGPTLIMNRGDAVQMHVTNNLDDETTTHWHGFHIPAVMDGGPHQPIAPGETWSPSFEIMNQAGTYWYHPHLHHMTQDQLTHGAGGLILIKDDEEAALALPRTYGVDDIPLILTSRRFDADSQFDLESAYGDYVLTNGVMDAQVTLPAQVVRLRLLNVETERAYDLGFSDDREFQVIATDGGLVNAPIPVTRMQLYVGERVEILVDLSDDPVGGSLALQAFNGGHPMGFPGGEPQQDGMFGSLLNNKTFDLLHIDVGAATDDPITAVPATLANNTYWTEADVTASRTLNITDDGPGTPFTFDGVGFDEATINQYVDLDAVEKWTISNGMTFGHSFHIHDVQFKIVARSDGEVADYEQGWKDVVRVPRNESVTFIAKFADFASPTDPFMYHCHMATHEDDGLMGQFLVQ